MRWDSIMRIDNHIFSRDTLHAVRAKSILKWWNVKLLVYWDISVESSKSSGVFCINCILILSRSWRFDFFLVNRYLFWNVLFRGACIKQIFKCRRNCWILNSLLMLWLSFALEEFRWRILTSNCFKIPFSWVLMLNCLTPAQHFCVILAFKTHLRF